MTVWASTSSFKAAALTDAGDRIPNRSYHLNSRLYFRAPHSAVDESRPVHHTGSDGLGLRTSITLTENPAHVEGSAS